MKTRSAKKEELEHKWHLVDAEGKILGRLASQVATLLRGKHKPMYTPHVDTGDHVIVINAEKIHLTGGKLQKKIYYRHSGFPGGLKAFHADEMLQRKPESMIQDAVRGMLPKNPLGKALFRKLKVYCGPTHRHEAQKPEPFELEKR